MCAITDERESCVRGSRPKSGGEDTAATKRPSGETPPRDPLVQAAVEALGAFSDNATLDALRLTLIAGDWWAPARTRRARTAAAAALKRIGTPGALDILKTALTTGGRGVRAAAREEAARLASRPILLVQIVATICAAVVSCWLTSPCFLW